MPRPGDPPQDEKAIFTKAVENVFRRLIRILVGRISLAKLQEMMGFIYVEEAELKLKRASPGKSVPLTKIALMTGLDARTVVGIRTKIQESGAMYQQKILRELTPESAIVEAWVDLINVTPANSRKTVRTLSYGGNSSGFEKLFRATISSRGITSQSIIQRLVATKNIQHNKEQKAITLLVSNFSPYLSDDESQNFNAAFTAISNLISSVENNLNRGSTEKLFQRQIWTFYLPKLNQFAFRKEFRTFLEKMESKARTKMEPWEAEGSTEDVMTAGVGFYYFEEAV